MKEGKQEDNINELTVVTIAAVIFGGLAWVLGRGFVWIFGARTATEIFAFLAVIVAILGLVLLFGTRQKENTAPIFLAALFLWWYGGDLEQRLLSQEQPPMSLLEEGSKSAQQPPKECRTPEAQSYLAQVSEIADKGGKSLTDAGTTLSQLTSNPLLAYDELWQRVLAMDLMLIVLYADKARQLSPPKLFQEFHTMWVKAWNKWAEWAQAIVNALDTPSEYAVSIAKGTADEAEILTLRALEEWRQVIQLCKLSDKDLKMATPYDD